MWAKALGKKRCRGLTVRRTVHHWKGTVDQPLHPLQVPRIFKMAHSLNYMVPPHP